MGVPNQKAVKHLLIANSTAAVITATNISTLANGQVAVAKPDGTILTTGNVANENEIIIAQGQASGLPLIVSPVIKKAGVRTYTGGKYIPETPQVDFVGYDGTSGSIDVLNSNAYDLRVYQWDHAAYAEKSHAVMGYHKSDSTATQAEIAAGVQLVATDTLKGLRLPSAPFKIEVLTDATESAAPVGATNLIFVNGSKVITGDTVNITPTLLVAGGFLKVATGVTIPAYKISSITAATATSPVLIFLESFYQGVSATVAATAVRGITVANAAAGNFGFKISGITQTVTSGNVLNGGLEDYYPVRFKTIANGFGSTVVATGTAFVAGNGLPVQVGVLERQLLGNEGYLFAGSMPYVAPRSNANFSSTYGYAAIHLEYTDKPVNAVLGFEEQPKQLDIAMELVTPLPAFALGLAAQNGGNGVLPVLENWLSSNGPFAPIIVSTVGGVIS